jgi:NMT1/THI5 like
MENFLIKNSLPRASTVQSPSPASEECLKTQMNKQRRILMKQFICIIYALVSLLVLFPVDLRGQTPRKVKLTIPVVALSMTPVYLAQAKNFFAEEGLDVDVTSTGGGGPDIRALIAGEVDFSYTTGDNVILAHQEGKPLIMVSSALNKLFINWAIHKESAKARGITETSPLQQKLKSLKGLTVGVTNPAALTAHLAHFDSQGGIYPSIRGAGHSGRRRTHLAGCFGKPQSRCGIDGSAGARDRYQSRVRHDVHRKH